MQQEIHITLRFDLATGKANLNEVVYELKELRDPLMLKILEHETRNSVGPLGHPQSYASLFP